MSEKGAQATEEQPTIERGELVSYGPDNWVVECTGGPAVPEGEVLLERYDRGTFSFDQEEINRCDCGRLVLGNDECYGCFKTGSGE